MRPALTLMRSACVSTIAEGYRRLLIDNASIPEPSSIGGNVPIPEVTEAKIIRVRERAKRIYLQKKSK
jgi:hypothetical protein